MAYAALSTVQSIATGQPFLAATLQQASDNFEFLIDPPACSIKETTAQSVANDTLVALTADEENFDNDSMHSTTVNTSRITIQTAGRYLLSSTVLFATDSDGERYTEFYVNATDRYHIQQVANTLTVRETIISGMRTVVLSAGDYVEVRARHTAGGAINVTLSEFAALFITR